MFKQLAHNRALAYVFGFLLALSLPGCGVLGWGDGKVDTARKGLVAADAEVRAGYLLLESLITSRSIDAATARSTKNKLDEARAGIRATFAAIELTGNPNAGADNLSKALVALDVAFVVLGGITATQ